MNEVDHGVFKIKMFLGVADDAGGAEGDVEGGEGGGGGGDGEEQKASVRQVPATTEGSNDHSLDELGASGIGGGADLAISKVLKGSSVNGMPRHSTIFAMRMGSGGGGRSSSWEIESKMRMLKQDLGEKG